ncbi:endonuclease/exonuclease/phosphatase family protein [Mangrovimonas xylaniphaga]|uniref:endonuclease/exonuclease/phosphatase family protein n=1 Tax=Mangrovimonas xylaniphaga TaxID=1645915 RepID=UPI000A55BC09|nr:endonuclease/exonuclease/phosphatase family protein [Mangrovimonas xylaniphaga]
MKYILYIITGLFFVNIYSQEADTFKVLTYNIWNGFDFGKDTMRLKNFQTWMKQQDVDVAALQELCSYTDQRLQEEAKQWGHNYTLLLKNTGYSVGITSKYPIELKERILKDLHHGALHCKIQDVDYIIVHLNPENIAKRRNEMKVLFRKIEDILKTTDKLIVLGDFNSNSPFDQHLYDLNGELIKRMEKEDNKKTGLNGNLDNGQLDYSVISGFLSMNLYDVLLPYSQALEQRISFPTPALIPRYFETESQVDSCGERIDYMLVSRALYINSLVAQALNGVDNDLLSDHYPVMAQFRK